MIQVKHIAGTRYFVSSCGIIFSTLNGFMTPMKPQISTNGYPYIKIPYGADKKRRNVSIHRLVANHFIANFSDLPQVNHRDGNKKNNDFTNLEWVSASENLMHACRVLGKRIGSKKKISKLTEDVVRKLRSGELSTKECVSRYNISRNSVYKAKNNWTWMHVVGGKS